MNWTYFKFVFLNTLKRTSLLIVWAVFLLMTIILLFVVPSAAKTSSLQAWGLSAAPLFQSFLIIIIAVTTALLTIIIFKNHNDEGTDLIIISKKTSKKGIVLIKFLVLALFSCLISISGCIVSCFAGLMPDFEIKFFVPLITGMLVGNLISFITFGSIASIACLKMNNIGVLLLNILLSVFFFAYQIIGSLTFATPLLTLKNNDVGATTYITMNRKDNGEYEEKHLVNLLPSSKISTQTSGYNIRNWNDVKQYWNDFDCTNKSKIYIATNLINQLGTSYFSTGIDEFAQRQANRIFGISSMYNYNLTNPVSPEVKNNKNSINWIYTGHIKADIEVDGFGTINADIPYSFAFPGYTISEQMAILDKTFDEKVPVGTYKKTYNSREEFVYFESSEWMKYSKGFTQMYNNIFKYDLLDVNGNPYYDLADIEPYDYQSAWCLKNTNLSKYYDLVWACLTNNTDKYLKDPLDTFDFDIKSVDDLNKRFIQFKYFVFDLAQKEQKDTMDNGPKEDEIQYYRAVVAELSDFVNKTGVEWVENSWYMTSTHGGTIPFLFLDSHSKVPAFPLLSGIIRYQGYDQPSCSYGTIMKCANIFNYCVEPQEECMFSTLSNDQIKRSSERSGKVYTISQRWLPAIVSQYAKYNQNWNIFFYETKRDMPIYLYSIIWLAISISLFGFAGATFKKYDIK